MRLAVLLAVLCTPAAYATVFVPMAVEDLARSSALIVVGTVKDLTGVESNGRVVTLVAIAVEQTLKGDLVSPVITLKENGGIVSGREEVIFGAPSFQPGEHVLLFLTTRADGILQTNQLAQGKFRIESDALGMARATQHFGPGTLVVIPPGGAPPSGPVPLDELLGTVRNALATGSVAATHGPLPVTPRQSAAAHEVTSQFTLLDDGRFFEADLGTPLTFLIDRRGDDILGPTASHQAVDDAFAAWTDVATASIVLADGGFTDDLTAPCDGPHKVRFNDPEGEIPPPVGCTGTLGVGGLCFDTAETKVFNNTTFKHGTRALLTLADGWQGCDVWNACNIAEIATHEIGHAIGMGHSSEQLFEPDPTLREATMYFVAHFDGRCASLRSDDTEGLGFLYPTATPPTITTQNPLPSGVVFHSYQVTFAATGGTAPYAWALAGGSFPGLNLSVDGVLSGVPAAIGESSLHILATDSKGDSHAKMFNIRVDLTAATPTPIPACLGDCNGDGAVTVDELIKGVNIALGTLGIDACPSFDANGDTLVTIDELVKGVNAALNGCAELIRGLALITTRDAASTTLSVPAQSFSNDMRQLAQRVLAVA